MIAVARCFAQPNFKVGRGVVVRNRAGVTSQEVCSRRVGCCAAKVSCLGKRGVRHVRGAQEPAYKGNQQPSLGLSPSASMVCPWGALHGPVPSLCHSANPAAPKGQEGPAGWRRLARAVVTGTWTQLRAGSTPLATLAGPAPHWLLRLVLIESSQLSSCTDGETEAKEGEWQSEVIQPGQDTQDSDPLHTDSEVFSSQLRTEHNVVFCLFNLRDQLYLFSFFFFFLFLFFPQIGGLCLEKSSDTCFPKTCT